MQPLYILSKNRLEETGDKRGFTLLELIVVTFLIGIMLSLSIPSLRNTFFTDPLKATTRKVIGLVGGVRELAAREQQPYLLHIDQSENRIWYEKDGNEEVEEVKNEERREGEVLFPETVRISGVWMAGEDDSLEGQTTVWISKQGYMNNTTIQIEDDDGGHLNVQFSPFLDSVVVSDQVGSF